MNMRKTYKRKRRSCALCKPHKVGKGKRWKAKEAAQLKAMDREIELTCGNKALMRLLDARARQSQSLSLGTVKAQLGISTARRRPARRRI